MDYGIKRECGVCPVEIWVRREGKLVKGPQYNEIDVPMSNGSLMTVGVCPMHKYPSKHDLAVIGAKAKRGWQHEVNLGIGNKKWVEDVGSNLTVVGAA